jgi:hypothetical protein
LLELRSIDAATFGKANRSRAWNTIFESLSDRRTFSLFTEIWLMVVQVGDRHHETARRSKDRNRSMAQPSFCKIVQNPVSELIERLTRKIRRQFFSADFKKKRCCHDTDMSQSDCIGSRFATVS